MKARPIGITILAVLLALNVALYVVLAALAIFSRSSLMAFLHALSPSGAGPEAIHTAMAGCCPCTMESWLE